MPPLPQEALPYQRHYKALYQNVDPTSTSGYVGTMTYSTLTNTLFVFEGAVYDPSGYSASGVWTALGSVAVGAQTTRAGVLGEVPATLPIGAVYQSTAGKNYIKVANAGAATDWQKVTSTAAD